MQSTIAQNTWIRKVQVGKILWTGQCKVYDTQVTIQAPGSLISMLYRAEEFYLVSMCLWLCRECKKKK